MRTPSFIVYRRKTEEKVKKIIDNIIAQLERYGRATATDGSAVKTLSRFMEEPIRREYIYFNYNNMHKKSVIVLPPSIRLIRIPNNKIRLVFEKDLFKQIEHKK